MGTPIKKLDTASFKKAIQSLDEAINTYHDDKNNAFVRDASIQRFEYTYELAHKMLKRYLELTEPDAEQIDRMSFPTLIRTGSERGLLLNGWDIWDKYRYSRNLTSHVYDEIKAIQVCEVIPDFLLDAKYLLNKLEERSIS